MKKAKPKPYVSLFLALQAHSDMMQHLGWYLRPESFELSKPLKPSQVIFPVLLNIAKN